MKKILLSAFAILSLAAPAMADPIVLPTGSPLFFQFLNLEQVCLTNCINVPDSATTTYGTAGNWGVVLITNIQTGFVTVPNQDIQGTGNQIFASALGSGQIYGIFYDITVTSPTTATGGILDLYWSDNGTIDMSTALPNSATVTQFTTGTFLARLDFASGIDPLNPTTTIKSNTDPTTLTGTGEADSFANVDLSAGGALAAALNGDWFQTAFGTRDLRFSNFFNLNPTWDTDGTGPIVGLRSNDPGRVFTAAASAVPEPATLTLLGFGLAALGARRRKKA